MTSGSFWYKFLEHFFQLKVRISRNYFINRCQLLIFLTVFQHYENGFPQRPLPPETIFCRYFDYSKTRVGARALAAAAGEEAWAPWLDSLPTDFDAFAYLDCEDVDKWVEETAQRWGLPADRLAETLGERRGAYARRAAWFFSDEGPAALCGASPESFRLAYCRVLSRAVTVDGKGCIGLVPFYDFLNHGRLGSEANVELLTYGQAVRRAGDASGAEGSFLDLDDMLLVATADIETGAELLTGYADAGADEDGYRVKLLLQYGICLPPA